MAASPLEIAVSPARKWAKRWHKYTHCRRKRAQRSHKWRQRAGRRERGPAQLRASLRCGARHRAVGFEERKERAQ
eukprot:3920668-Rhodomonas_salina.1